MKSYKEALDEATEFHLKERKEHQSYYGYGIDEDTKRQHSFKFGSDWCKSFLDKQYEAEICDLERELDSQSRAIEILNHEIQSQESIIAKMEEAIKTAQWCACFPNYKCAKCTALTALKEFRSTKETTLPEEGVKYHAGSQFGPPREKK